MTQEGRITSTDQRLYTTSNVVFRPSKISAEDLQRGYLDIYRRIYSWKNILRRMPEHQHIGYLLFNFLYRKYGNATERICRAIGFNRIGRVCENLSFKLF